MKVKLVWLKWISLVIGNISFFAWIFFTFTGSFTVPREAGIATGLFAAYLVFAAVIPLNMRLFALRWLNRMGYTVKKRGTADWTADKPGYGVSGCHSVEDLYDSIYFKVTEAATS